MLISSLHGIFSHLSLWWCTEGWVVRSLLSCFLVSTRYLVSISYLRDLQGCTGLLLFVFLWFFLYSYLFIFICLSLYSFFILTIYFTLAFILLHLVAHHTRPCKSQRVISYFLNSFVFLFLGFPFLCILSIPQYSFIASSSFSSLLHPDFYFTSQSLTTHWNARIQKLFVLPLCSFPSLAFSSSSSSCLSPSARPSSLPSLPPS